MSVRVYFIFFITGILMIYQLVTIYKADLSMPILKAQEIIAALKSSTLIKFQAGHVA